jgi:DUF1680 family protein
MSKIEPVPFTDVTIQDRFWAPRQEVNRTVTVEHCLQMLEEAGNLDNFRLAAAGKHEGYHGPVYMDSDLYKVLEGISYTLATHPDPALDRRTDEIVDLLAAAQMPDGYLNTWHQVNKPNERWTNIRDRHELYCAGHLIEAAVAHRQATGKRNLLGVALKFCEHIWLEFGPGGKTTACGHPEIELALMKLWKLTGDQRWFALTQRFLDNRGNGYFADEHGTPRDQYDGTYWIDDVPVRRQRKLNGHAVRATYLMCAVADVARETDDKELDHLLTTLWANTTFKRMYVTGGIGSSESNEGFTEDFDLPNATAYQETCASIAMAMWGHRMCLLQPNGVYFDIVETTLYNAMLSGVGLDGKSFFYVNPLEDDGSHRREPWFECACCPPNILRTIASIGGYIYAKSENALYINMLVSGSLETEVGGRDFKMDVDSGFPFNGDVLITIQSEHDAMLFIRTPDWESGVITVNGQPIGYGLAMDMVNYGFVQRNWKPGDQIRIEGHLSAELIKGDPRTPENGNKVAVRRGPFIFCAEQIDNPNPPAQIHLSPSAELKLQSGDKAIPNIVTADGATFIPYAYWANRQPGSMRVWIPK